MQIVLVVFACLLSGFLAVIVYHLSLKNRLFPKIDENNQQKRKEMQFRTLFDIMCQAMIYYNDRGVVEYSNKASSTIFGDRLADLSRVDSSGHSLYWLSEEGQPLEQSDLPMYRSRYNHHKIHNQIFGISLHTNSSPRWFLVNSFPDPDYLITTGKQSGNLPVFLVLLEITDQVRATQLLQSSLDEKKVLLREVHHRVKNNLNIVVSLMNLQSDRVQGPEDAQRALEKSRSQITCISLAHQGAYTERSLDSVSMQQYFVSLIAQALAGLEKQYTYQVLTHDQDLSISQAVSCGLIVNELISNILEHSDADEFLVELKALDPERLRLLIWDNGKNLPENTSFNDLVSGQSLGLTLVHLLAGQLGGKINLGIDHQGCALFTLDFTHVSEDA